MRFRIYSPVITALALLALFAVGSAAAAPTLSKPAARKAAVAKMNRFLASHSWADAGKVGRCQRKAPRRVLCKLILRGPSRSCSSYVRVVPRKGKARGKIAGLRCQTSGPLEDSDRRVVQLRAWLGAPGREQQDPFLVTYPHGAEATAAQRLASDPEEPVPTSPGVLALYVDGKLECAQNVNEANAEATCPVDYDKLGTYRITTIYTAGSESATDSILHSVEPLSTETHVSVSYEPLAVTSSHFGCGDDSTCHQDIGWWENGMFNVGVVTVAAAVTPWGTVPHSACGSTDPNCISVDLGADGEAQLPVSAMADYNALEEKDLGIGETLAIEPEAVKSVSLPGIGQVSITTLEAGSIHFRFSSGTRPGYVESTAEVPVSFVPAITSPVERVACAC